MKKKITLLGGSGFLGSHVADELSKKGYEVTIFDIKNAKWLRDDQKFVKGNILNDKDLEKVIKKSTYVFNFASISDIEDSLKNPLETAKVNIVALIKILKLCVKNKIKQYVHASSVYVSGDRGGFYKSSKIAAESYVEEFFNIYGLKYSILRYGTLYGERSDKNNGLHQIIKNAILKKRIEYSGDLNAMRDYINVIDAAKASTKALTKDFQNKVVIISGSQTIKVSDILEIISEMMSLKKKIKYIKKNKLMHHTHYVRTPYTIKEPLIMKFNENFHIDIGQGLSNLIKELKVTYQK
jgi:UDP-glucose 4-epimerase